MLKEYLRHVCLILLMTCVAVSQDVWSEDDLSTVTGNTYLFEGEDLRLTCTVPDHLNQYTAHDISFGFQDIKNGGQAKCLPNSSIQIIDEKSAMLILQNVTVGGGRQYTCYAGDKHCQRYADNDDLELIGSPSNDVEVEYSPKNVTNFHCVVYNWNDSMKCTWQHPVDYINWNKINVASGFTISSNEPVIAHRCPKLSNNECQFDEFILVKDYVIEVNVTNTVKNITATKCFRVDTHQAVKPAPVIELMSKADENDPTCLVLSWQHPKKSWWKVYRISHQSIKEDGTFKVLADNYADTTNTTCGYDPYTHHNFSVEVYPAYIYSGYWSDPVYTDVWTPMTAPDVGPSITNGSFTGSSCISGFRNVTLMWQDVEESSRNGIIDGYLIKHGDQILKNLTEKHHLTVVELPCHSASELRIFSHNKGGYSRVPSVLLIPSANFGVSESIVESFAVEINKNNNSLRALWNMNEDTENISYTIFWCSGLPGQICESQIKWSKVPGTKTEYNIPISLSDATKYMYGISVTNTQTGITSGIFWTECLFIRDPQNVQPVRSMEVEGGVESARVSWTHDHCSYQNQVKVTSFKVKYCETPFCDEPDKIMYKEVSAKESSLTVSPLKAGADYKLTVLSVSDGIEGQEVQPWKEAHITPKESLPLGWIICSVVIVVAVFGFFFVCRKFQTRRRRFDKLTSRKFLDIESANQNANQHVPNDCSPPMSPSYPVDRLLPVTTATTADQCQTNQCHGSVIESGQRGAECTSGESSLDDPLVDSRSHLIKSASCKKHEKRCPQPILENVVELGSPSTLKHSADVLKNSDIAENVCMDYVQQNVQTYSNGISQHGEGQADVAGDQARWNSSNWTESESDQTDCAVIDSNDLALELSAAGLSRMKTESDGVQQLELINFDQKPVPTCSESMTSYIHIAGTSSDPLTDAQEGQRKCVQGIPAKQTLGKITASPNNIVLRVELAQKGHGTAERPNVEGYSTIVDLETTCPDRHEVVLTILPATSSVLGQDRSVEASIRDSEETASNQSSDVNTGASSCDQSSSHSHEKENQNSNGYLPNHRKQ